MTLEKKVRQRNISNFFGIRKWKRKSPLHIIFFKKLETKTFLFSSTIDIAIPLAEKVRQLSCLTTQHQKSNSGPFYYKKSRIIRLNFSATTMKYSHRVWVHWVRGPINCNTLFKIMIILGTVPVTLLIFSVSVPGSSRRTSILHPDLRVQKKLVQRSQRT